MRRADAARSLTRWRHFSADEMTSWPPSWNSNVKIENSSQSNRRAGYLFEEQSCKILSRSKSSDNEISSGPKCGWRFQCNMIMNAGIDNVGLQCTCYHCVGMSGTWLRSNMVIVRWSTRSASGVGRAARPVFARWRHNFVITNSVVSFPRPFPSSSLLASTR